MLWVHIYVGNRGQLSTCIDMQYQGQVSVTILDYLPTYMHLDTVVFGPVPFMYILIIRGIGALYLSFPIN